MSNESSSSSGSGVGGIGIELACSCSMYSAGGRSQAYRMRVEVVLWQGLDPNIFVYQNLGPDQATGGRYGEFDRVASPNDLEELPVNVPDADTSPQPDYFRLAEVDLLFRCTADRDAAWAAIKQDQEELIRTLNQLDTLTLNEINIAGSLD